MKKYFLPYPLALLLKEKGFNEQTLMYYLQEDNMQGGELNHGGVRYWISNSFINKMHSKKDYKPVCAAPLYDQVLSWFRETHEIHINVDFFTVYEEGINRYTKRVYYPGFGPLEYQMIELGKEHGHIVKESFTDYREALNAAIEYALTLIGERVVTPEDLQ